MNKMFQKLRFFFSAILHGSDSAFGLAQQVYKIYVNHSKIIHFRENLPVYSLTLPALFSKPANNLIARLVFKVIQNRNLPMLLSFAITPDCNANCKHCSFFDDQNGKKHGTILSTSEAKKVIADAQNIGVTTISFVGGEPLVRSDIMEIISSIDKSLSCTLMFTNGAKLAPLAKNLKFSGLDSVFVSIDSPNPQEHDRLRGTKNLFAQAIKGIESAIGSGLSVGISTYLSKEDYLAGKLKKMCDLAKSLGVHELIVFEVSDTGRRKSCTNQNTDRQWVWDMIKESNQYNEDMSYPGILIYPYVTSYLSNGCYGGTNYLYISPFGDVCPCDFNHASFGNIRQQPLHSIWEDMSSREYFRKTGWGGCKLKDPQHADKDYVQREGYSKN